MVLYSHSLLHTYRICWKCRNHFPIGQEVFCLQPGLHSTIQVDRGGGRGVPECMYMFRIQHIPVAMEISLWCIIDWPALPRPTTSFNTFIIYGSCFLFQTQPALCLLPCLLATPHSPLRPCLAARLVGESKKIREDSSGSLCTGPIPGLFACMSTPHPTRTQPWFWCGKCLRVWWAAAMEHHMHLPRSSGGHVGGFIL